MNKIHRRYRRCLVALGAVFFIARLGVAAEPWNLPHTISDRSTTVRFEVDSTWHLVEGKTAGVHGRIWLENPADPLSIRIQVGLPVGRFDTDRESRDEKLRTVMHADRFPEVMFVGRAAVLRSGVCRPEELLVGAGCALDIGGELRIRDVVKEVVLPVVVTKTTGGFEVKGELSLRWADYGVEDPSIIIAKLDPTVVVRVVVELTPNGAAGEMGK